MVLPIRCRYFRNILTGSFWQATTIIVQSRAWAQNLMRFNRVPNTMSKPNSTPAPALQTLALLIGSLLLPGPVLAQNFPVTAQQRATAAQVASSGVALSELRADAPQNYTVKAGDTLWAISGLFLKSP